MTRLMVPLRSAPQSSTFPSSLQVYAYAQEERSSPTRLKLNTNWDLLLDSSLWKTDLRFRHGQQTSSHHLSISARPFAPRHDLACNPAYLLTAF